MRHSRAKRGAGFQRSNREVRVTVSTGPGKGGKVRPEPIMATVAGTPAPYVEAGVEWTWSDRLNGYVSRLGRRASKLDHPGRKRMPRKTDSSRHFHGLTQSGQSGGAGHVPSDPLRLEAEQDGFDRREHGHNPVSKGKQVAYADWSPEDYQRWLDGEDVALTWQDGRRPKPKVEKDPIDIRIAPNRRVEQRHATEDAELRLSGDKWDPVAQRVVTDERFAQTLSDYRVWNSRERAL